MTTKLISKIIRKHDDGEIFHNYLLSLNREYLKELLSDYYTKTYNEDNDENEEDFLLNIMHKINKKEFSKIVAKHIIKNDILLNNFLLIINDIDHISNIDNTNFNTTQMLLELNKLCIEITKIVKKYLGNYGFTTFTDEFKSNLKKYDSIFMFSIGIDYENYKENFYILDSPAYKIFDSLLSYLFDTLSDNWKNSGFYCIHDNYTTNGKEISFFVKKI